MNTVGVNDTFRQECASSVKVGVGTSVRTWCRPSCGSAGRRPSASSGAYVSRSTTPSDIRSLCLREPSGVKRGWI